MGKVELAACDENLHEQHGSRSRSFFHSFEQGRKQQHRGLCFGGELFLHSLGRWQTGRIVDQDLPHPEGALPLVLDGPPGQDFAVEPCLFCHAEKEHVSSPCCVSTHSIQHQTRNVGVRLTMQFLHGFCPSPLNFQYPSFHTSTGGLTLYFSCATLSTSIGAFGKVLCGSHTDSQTAKETFQDPHKT